MFRNHAPKTVDASLAWRPVKEWTDRPGEEKNGVSPLCGGTIFHRIIADFMIQGGDFTWTRYRPRGTNSKTNSTQNSTSAEPYKLAMANAGPGTNGSQFFITSVATPHLQNRHTIFGEVTDEDSQKVVDELNSVPTGPQDRPVNDVVIETIEITEL